MIFLRKNIDSKGISYFYFPEGREDYGVIEVKEKNVIIKSESNADKELGYPYYANKARLEVLNMLKNENYEDKKFLIWY